MLSVERARRTCTHFFSDFNRCWRLLTTLLPQQSSILSHSVPNHICIVAKVVFGVLCVPIWHHNVSFRFMFECSVAFILTSSRVYNVYVFIYLAFWCYFHETSTSLCCSLHSVSFQYFYVLLGTALWCCGACCICATILFFLIPFCTVFVKKLTSKRISYCWILNGWAMSMAWTWVWSMDTWYSLVDH